jgi:hypothetical protein
MASCSLFKDFTNPFGKKSLLLIAKDIASDKFKAEIDRYQECLKSGKTEKAAFLKKKLMAFTPSGIFKEKRQLKFLEMYSGLIHLDFDKLTEEDLERTFQIISKIPYTLLCFRSPSGNGLKVFVEVDTNEKAHTKTYLKVQRFYENATGLKADPSCKDITRLCFFSHDPKLYKNIENTIFKANEDFNSTKKEELPPKLNSPHIPDSPDVNLDTIFCFNQQVLFTNTILKYEQGNRNNYIFRLANNCNRVGIAEMDLEKLCTQHFDLPEYEIKNIIRNVYTKNRAEHNKIQPKQEGENQVEDESDLKMENFPDEIYNTIPDFLKRVVKFASSKEEKDILLLGALTTLSVVFPKVYGLYDNKMVHANLYLFISAPASAGKGTLPNCKKLIYPIHKELHDSSKLMKQQYQNDLNDYNAMKGQKGPKPLPPPQKMLFIPANNSSTGFFELLHNSNGRGIIFETEADTLTKAFNSEHGNFSDGLRNAFQHETHSYYRRTEKELVEILRPCVSAVLSGTPKQLISLMPNAENGLFSRFIYYLMNMNIIWKNVFESNTPNGLEKHFELLGDELYYFLKNHLGETEIVFSVTNEQQLAFNQFFVKLQLFYFGMNDIGIIGTIRRLGLISYRIMMIFSVLRMMENKIIVRHLVCKNQDLENVLKMAEVLVKHSNTVYNQMEKDNKAINRINKKELFLRKLPVKFSRKDYLQVALTLNIPDKTAQTYIKQFKDAGIIQSDGHDSYTIPHNDNPRKQAS